MNYKHQYHFGNFADIFKHIILTVSLEEFVKNKRPFLAIDTHAGDGKYSFDPDFINGSKSHESQNGILKILKNQEITNLLPKKFLDILAKINLTEIENLKNKILSYSGSPYIIKYFIQPWDKGIFCELEEGSFNSLKRNFAGNKKFLLLKKDGFKILEHEALANDIRKIILIDPPFEKFENKISNDYQRIINFLEEAKNHPQDLSILVWYPIIDENFIKNFHFKINKIGFKNILYKTIKMPENLMTNKMNSCGMLIINPVSNELEKKINDYLLKISQFLTETAI